MSTKTIPGFTGLLALAAILAVPVMSANGQGQGRWHHEGGWGGGHDWHHDGGWQGGGDGDGDGGGCRFCGIASTLLGVGSMILGGQQPVYYPPPVYAAPAPVYVPPPVPAYAPPPGVYYPPPEAAYPPPPVYYGDDEGDDD